MSRGRKKKENLTLEENLVRVTAQIKETEEQLKRLRSQRREIEKQIKEQEKEQLYNAVATSGKPLKILLSF